MYVCNSFDMVITDLRANYGEPYNNAYFEINKVLRQYEFYNTQGSVYLTEKTDMANLFRAIDALKRIPWFQASVRDSCVSCRRLVELYGFYKRKVDKLSGLNMYSCLKAPFYFSITVSTSSTVEVLLHRFPCFLHCISLPSLY